MRILFFLLSIKIYTVRQTPLTFHVVNAKGIGVYLPAPALFFKYLCIFLSRGFPVVVFSAVFFSVVDFSAVDKHRSLSKIIGWHYGKLRIFITKLKQPFKCCGGCRI